MSADDSTVRGSWPGGYRGAGSDMLGWRWRLCWVTHEIRRNTRRKKPMCDKTRTSAAKYEYSTTCREYSSDVQPKSKVKARGTGETVLSV